MNTAEVSLREGKEDDIPQVLGLIQELAVFEKEPEAVVVSIDEMVRDGFGPAPLYGLFVAEVNQRIVGTSIFYYRYSTWNGKCLYLEDLIITESYRGQGIGKRLFSKTLQKAKDEKCRKMNWQVLDWNTPAIKFYEDFDATMDPEWLNGYINL
ncbi:MAG: GNAT superfamily N-acetyltransferase [Bacteroidia bacterium]|jgi:GNAT superfamily N-acetyltransferase